MNKHKTSALILLCVTSLVDAAPNELQVRSFRGTNSPGTGPWSQPGWVAATNCFVKPTPANVWIASTSAVSRMSIKGYTLLGGCNTSGGANAGESTLAVNAPTNDGQFFRLSIVAMQRLEGRSQSAMRFQILGRPTFFLVHEHNTGAPPVAVSFSTNVLVSVLSTTNRIVLMRYTPTLATAPLFWGLSTARMDVQVKALP